MIFVHVPRTAGTSIENYFQKVNPSVPITLGDTMPPNHIMSLIGENRWNNYYKFTVVRNPYDRLVSTYILSNLRSKYSMGDIIKSMGIVSDASISGFHEYVQKIARIGAYRRVPDLQVNWLKSGGQLVNHELFSKNYSSDKLVVDRVLRFENLEEDFFSMLKELNLPQHKLSHLNKSDRLPFESYYSEREYEIVRKVYKEDFASFGYNE